MQVKPTPGSNLRQVFDLVAESPEGITNADIQDVLTWPSTKITNTLRNLVRAGYIRPTGERRSGRAGGRVGGYVVFVAVQKGTDEPEEPVEGPDLSGTQAEQVLAILDYRGTEGATDREIQEFLCANGIGWAKSPKDTASRRKGLEERGLVRDTGCTRVHPTTKRPNTVWVRARPGDLDPSGTVATTRKRGRKKIPRTQMARALQTIWQRTRRDSGRGKPREELLTVFQVIHEIAAEALGLGEE